MGETTERAFTFHVKSFRCFSAFLRRRLRSVDVLKPTPLYSRFALSHKKGRSHEDRSRFYVLSSKDLLGPPTKFTTLSELSFTTRPSVRLMRNRPVEQMEGIYDLKQQLEEHLRSALRHLSCVSSFKARLVRARGWPTPCRGSTARSGSVMRG